MQTEKTVKKPCSKCGNNGYNRRTCESKTVCRKAGVTGRTRKPPAFGRDPTCKPVFGNSGRRRFMGYQKKEKDIRTYFQKTDEIDALCKSFRNMSIHGTPFWSIGGQ